MTVTTTRSATQPKIDRRSGPHIAPTFGRGLAVAGVYALVFMVAGLISGVDYDNLSKSASNVIGFVIIPVGLATGATLAITARWAWWQMVFHETQRLVWPRWRWAIPALFVFSIVTTLIVAPWHVWSTALVLLILLGTLMVGFGEELIFRGYLLVAARARFSEAGAWFVTSALFGLFHGLNILTGQSVRLTLQQIVIAFLMGSGLYLVRRISGLLVVGMVIHAFWDFSTFIGAGRGADTGGVPKTIVAAPFTYGMILLTIVVLVGLFRRGKDVNAPVSACA